MPDIGDPNSAAVVSWVEANIGGTVTAVSRQPRWRPVWFVDVDRAGERLGLCVRGERADTELVFPLAHEMRFQQILHEHGISVPKVYGWIDEPAAFVMDRVPGRADFADVSAADRDRVVEEYLRALVAMHSLDLAPFVEAGIERADRPERSGLLGMRRFEELFRKQKVQPDPFMEFGLSWYHRHPPRSRGREAPVVWDSGQFHHEGGHLTSLVDLELGHLGDPMMDLAGWRMRDSIMHYGSFPALYRRYGELTGRPVDLEAIQLHHFAFTLSNQLSFSHTLRQPPPASDYMTNLQWCNETNLYATEALGEYLAIELPTVEDLEPRDSRVTPVHEHLVRGLRAIQTDDAYSRRQLRTAFRLANHLKRLDEIGDVALAADLDDLHQVLGHRPDGWRAGEEELERFVLADAADGRHDEELVVLFHKRNLRAQMLNGAAGSAMVRHIPIQPF